MRPGARAALEAALAAGQTGSQDVSEVSGAQPGTVISSERSESRNLAVNVGVPSGPRPGSFDVSELSSDRLEALLAEGMLAVQDPSAMAAVEALAPQPGENVLDLCASPGTKTMQIVERMGDCGRVVACDRTAEKLESIRRTVAARGLKSVTVCVSDIAARPPVEGASPVASSKPATTGGLPASADGGLLFDAALVDAPCSNTGVLARRPEARWRLRSEDLEELPRVQLILLTQAALRVRPGGRLVYSTCSLQREENDGVVRAFLKQNPAWRVVRSEQILPSADHDGAFWALLAR
jgi:16S rRNA (cytosine967-C5)-methyltransferase